MQHLEEGIIHAWIDGALDAEESARVEQHVAECAMCANAVAEARGFVAGASRILAALDEVPSGVVPRTGGSLGGGGASGQRRPRSLWTFLHMTPTRAAAAAILIVAAGTVLVIQERPTAARESTFQVSTPAAPRPQVSVPATPLPQSTVADSAAILRAAAREESAPAAIKTAVTVPRGTGNGGPGTGNSSAPVVAQSPRLLSPVPAPRATTSLNADVKEKRSLEQVQVTASMDTVRRMPAPAARALTDSYSRKALENAQLAVESRAAVVGGAAPAASAMPARASARLTPLPNYAGCYSVAARGDSVSPLPKLLSLDSARFDKTLGYLGSVALFAVSSVTDAGRRPIDTASWQPRLDGVRISFGRTPIDLRRSADSTLFAAGVAGRDLQVTLQRVDCPPR